MGPRRIPAAIITTAFVAASCALWAYSEGPPAAKTGAPGQNTCVECHTGHPLNSGDGSLALTGLPSGGYEPGKVYDLTVSLGQPGQRMWGFEATAVTGTSASTLARAGEILITDTANTQFAAGARPGGPQYIEHTLAGTRSGTVDGPVTWSFQWKAPEAGTGPVTFYVSGNAANANGSNTGDFIYRQSFPVAEAAPAPSVTPGDVNQDGTVSILDVLEALRSLVNLVTLTPDQQKAGDVAPASPAAGQPAGDGAVDIRDVIRLLRRVAGLEPVFP